MYVSVFFLLDFFLNDKLIYISSPFSNQGLPEVNEFLFIHPKSQCLYIVYTIITAIFQLEILDFFKEFLKKVVLSGVHPTGHRH